MREINLNNHKPINKLFVFCFISFLLLANNSYAVDMEVLQAQCAEIGFKIKTPANGKCVLNLMRSVKSSEAKVATEQRVYEEQNNARAAEREQTEALRQQQAEMYELQRRSVAAQEQAAKAQTDAVTDAANYRSQQANQS